MLVRSRSKRSVSPLAHCRGPWGGLQWPPIPGACESQFIIANSVPSRCEVGRLLCVARLIFFFLFSTKRRLIDSLETMSDQKRWGDCPPWPWATIVRKSAVQSGATRAQGLRHRPRDCPTMEPSPCRFEVGEAGAWATHSTPHQASSLGDLIAGRCQRRTSFSSWRLSRRRRPRQQRPAMPR